MNQLYNDPCYTEFSYVRSFEIKLSNKPEHEEDIVAEMGGCRLYRDEFILKISFQSNNRRYKNMY